MNTKGNNEVKLFKFRYLMNEKQKKNNASVICVKLTEQLYTLAEITLIELLFWKHFLFTNLSTSHFSIIISTNINFIEKLFFAAAFLDVIL